MSHWKSQNQEDKWDYAHSENDILKHGINRLTTARNRQFSIHKKNELLRRKTSQTVCYYTAFLMDSEIIHSKINGLPDSQKLVDYLPFSKPLQYMIFCRIYTRRKNLNFVILFFFFSTACFSYIPDGEKMYKMIKYSWESITNLWYQKSSKKNRILQ